METLASRDLSGRRHIARGRQAGQTCRGRSCSILGVSPRKNGWPVLRRGFRITSYLGKGFPSVGTWTYDKFKPYVTQKGIAWDYRQGHGAALEGGKPFPGFAWRSTPELNINAIWLYRYMSRPETGTSKVWWAHLVVAKKYIGPLTPRRDSRSAGVRGD